MSAWVKSGDGTAGSPERWTSADGRTVIEKHPFASKYMVLVDGGLRGIVPTLAEAQEADTYRSRAARDAAESGYGKAPYWAYLDRHAVELAEKFPDRAEYFMTRTLGEALIGNDGD